MKFIFAQSDYSGYYEAISRAYYKNGEYEKMIKKAFRLNKPLPIHLIDRAETFFLQKNYKKAKKYLYKSALAGISETEIKKLEIRITDSCLKADKKLKKKFDNSYQKFLRKKCDIVNSIKIEKLFVADQLVRTYYADYNTSDTNYIKYRGKELIKQDSINYFTLISIMNEPGFNSSLLTCEAKEGLRFILLHSATNPYVNPDTVFAIMKKEMLKGTILPEMYARSYDRYYLYTFGMNYYCHFYMPQLPIYDIENVDKRRAELWIYPLYFKFKWNGELDKLPEGYKYDPNIIGK